MIQAQARKTAVAACKLAADGHTRDMDTLIGLYVRDAKAEGVTEQVAMRVLAHALVGLTVHVAGEDGPGRFDHLAHRMAALS